MKLGLEVEFFVKKNDKFIIVSDFGIPRDEYPILAEARGLPYNNAFQAVASVEAEINRINSTLIKTNGCVAHFVNWIPKDKEIKELNNKILRNGIDKRISYQNLYGKSISSKNDKNISAGLHITFTREQVIEYVTEKGGIKKTESISYNKLFDFPTLFRSIENEFIKEINDSGRVPGFYEIKHDGKVEYRSLPATLILDKLFAERLNNAIKKVTIQ